MSSTRILKALMKEISQVNDILCNETWLVVGPPLWKIWFRQLGWLATQFLGENKKWQPDHQPETFSDNYLQLFHSTAEPPQFEWILTIVLLKMAETGGILYFETKP